MALRAHSTSNLKLVKPQIRPSVIRCTSGVGFRIDLVSNFINDLLDNIRSSVCLLADDCVLYRNIYSIQGCLTMHEDITSLEQ